MDESRSNVIPFRRREEVPGQGQLPLMRVSAIAPRPLDEHRVAHRRRMLEFLLSQRKLQFNVQAVGYSK